MNSDISFSKVPWNSAYQELWKRSIESKRIPHALLLVGGKGIGKRSFAEWIIKQHLKIDYNSDVSMHPYSIPHHADLKWISPEEGKRDISIGQIRKFVDTLLLTSYEGIGKVGVIEPYAMMNNSSSNGLLKILEEPPGNTLIILIADSMHNIPATIISRCQLLRMMKPTKKEALVWLKQHVTTNNWEGFSEHYLDSPLDLLKNYGQIKNTPIYEKKLISILSKNESPLDLALDLSKENPIFVLDWMGNFIGCLIKDIFTPDKNLIKNTNNIQDKLNEFNLFLFLDKINKLRNQPEKSYNFQMALEGLLIDWRFGLKNLEPPLSEYNELPSVIFKSVT